MRQLKILKSITNRDQSSIDAYLQEIGKVKLIDQDEEVSLAYTIRTTKDEKVKEDAIRQLCEANLRFVVSVAKQYQNQGLGLGDLINEGNVGLVKAAEKFDETRGFKFISYAVWWIRQSIMQAISEQSRMVRLPLNQITLLNHIRKFQKDFLMENLRDATVEEISSGLELEVEKVKRTMAASANHTSYDATFGDDEEGTLLDVIPDTEAKLADDLTDKQSMANDINRVLSTLTDRESLIIQKTFGLNGNQPRSLEEIGEELGLTRERVRQILAKSIKRIQRSKRADLIKKYL